MLRALFGLLLFVSPLHAETITGASAGGGGSGTVTSISAGCGSSTGGSAITTTGTIAAVEPVDLETGSNFAIPNSDCGYLVNLSNGSAQTPTIAQAGAAGNFTAGWYADVCNIGAGTQTLTPATSTIGGNASQAIKTNQCIRVVSDGTNYQIGYGAPGLTAAGNVLAPLGALGTPGYTFNGQTAIGLYATSGGLFVGTTANYSWIFNTAGLIFGQYQGTSRGGINLVGGATGHGVSLQTDTGTESFLFYEGGTGASAFLSVPTSAVWQLGVAAAASPVNQTLQVQGSRVGTDSNVAGGNLLIQPGVGTGNATPSSLNFDTWVATTSGSTTQTQTATMTLTAGLVSLPNIASDATHTDGTVCEDTTSHALYAGSGTAGICLGTSSARYKHDVESLDVGLPQIMALQPVRYHLNADHGDPAKMLYGFTAEQGITALPQLTGMDAQGRPNTFDYMGVVPVLVRAIQQQQAEIEALKQAR